VVVGSDDEPRFAPPSPLDEPAVTPPDVAPVSAALLPASPPSLSPPAAVLSSPPAVSMRAEIEAPCMSERAIAHQSNRITATSARGTVRTRVGNR